MTAFEFNDRLMKMEDTLQRLAIRLTADKVDAQDLVQDTYLKAITHRDKFVDYSNLNGWVFTIMKNTFINNYRRDVKVNALVDTTRNLNQVDYSEDKGMIFPESSYSEREIAFAINSLSDIYRVPFKMYVDGFRYKEIGEELSLSIGTVKSRIFFARQKLMTLLKDFKD